MKSYPLKAYKDAGCTMVAATDQAAVFIWQETNGAMCPGCHAYHNGGCKSYRALISGNSILNRQQTESVRDEAARRGVSIKQVRRERAAAV